MKEDAGVVAEYAALDNEPTDARFVFEPHLNFPINHGDEVTATVMMHHPDGTVVDAAFPNGIRGELSLWGVDEQTANFLSWLVQLHKPRVIFETGTNRGRSTLAIAETMPDDAIFLTVDAADHGVPAMVKERTGKNVAFEQGRLPVCLENIEMKGIEFAFLDGPHTADEVVAELNFVRIHKGERCLVAIDNASDVGWPEIPPLMDEIGAFVLPTHAGLGLLWL